MTENQRLAVQAAHEKRVAAERQLQRLFIEAVPLGSRLRVAAHSSRRDRGAEYAVMGHGYVPGTLTVCRVQRWRDEERNGGPIAADLLMPIITGEITVVPQ
jgi:hypothetical protein